MGFFRKRFMSFRFAVKGLSVLFMTQPNAWIHAVAIVVVALAGILLRISLMEWALVCIAIGLVISAEAFNTSIEKLVDHISPENNKNAGTVKDLAAAAVLVTAVTALIIGIVVFVPKILFLFQK
jgi:diacylglycerol kinase